MKDQRRSGYRVHDRTPFPAALSQCGMQLEDLFHALGDIRARHRTGVHSYRVVIRRDDRLNPAISTFEEIQVYRIGGRYLSEMGFDSYPANIRETAASCCAGEWRPTSRSVDDRLSRKSLMPAIYGKWSGTAHSLNTSVLACFDS